MPIPIKIGITGGIGSGKSYICDIFRKLGVEVYNTDDEVKSDIIRREVVRKQVIAEFGGDSYLKDGSIHRDKFKKLLFTNPDQRTKMNEIVNDELLDSIDKWTKRKDNDYVLIECAPLFENGIDKHLDGVIVVTCPMSIRIERLLKRGVSRVDIDNIMRAQWSDEQKIRFSDYGIFNDENVEEAVEELDKGLIHYAKGFNKAMARAETRLLQHSPKGT